jgi:hypothetical protein
MLLLRRLFIGKKDLNPTKALPLDRSLDGGCTTANKNDVLVSHLIND